VTGKWLGKAAVLWALDEARTKDGKDVPAALVSTLIAVARFASEDGTGAYPSARDVATLTRKSMRQAQRDIDGLEKLGLILRGDQRKAIHIPFHHRPIVYDLPIGPYDTHDVAPTTYRVSRYDTHDAGIRHPRRTKRSGTDREDSAVLRSGAGAPRSAAQPGKASVCDSCRSGDHGGCPKVNLDDEMVIFDACPCWCSDFRCGCPNCQSDDHGSCLSRSHCYCNVCNAALTSECDDGNCEKCPVLLADGETWCMDSCHDAERGSWQIGHPPTKAWLVQA
jgi:hypothetical protein